MFIALLLGLAPITTSPLSEKVQGPLAFERYPAQCINVNNQPLTEKSLRHMDPRDVGLFYDLLMKVRTLFNRHQLDYWATCGTLLGAIRHQGMIPWDDDIDLAIYAADSGTLESLREDLEKIGLKLIYADSLGFYKIFYKSGLPIVNKDGSGYYLWTYPFIDVFPLKEVEGKINYANTHWQKKHPNEYFLPQELTFPLLLQTFGPISIPIPHDAAAYLQRAYGADWNDFAYVDYDHKAQHGVKKVKVKLTDRSPPAYILPETP